MKRLIITSLLAILLLVQGLFLVSPQQAHAVAVTNEICNGANAKSGGASGVCQDVNAGGGNPLLGPNGVITKVVQIFTIIIGIVAVVVLMLAGLRFVSANGNPNSIAAARSTILYAVIGLAVTAASQAIVSLVLSKVNV